MSITQYLNTSVADAKISLELRLQTRPGDTARDAIAMLEQLQGKEDQGSRIKMLAGIVRKAAKQLAE